MRTGSWAMARKVLLLILALAGCSKGAEADLPAIGEARSLAAEWALVNDQAEKDRITNSYTQTMRQSVRAQLQTTSKALTKPQSVYGQEIGALMREPDDAAPAKLRAYAGKLKHIEDSLESA